MLVRGGTRKRRNIDEGSIPLTADETSAQRIVDYLERVRP